MDHRSSIPNGTLSIPSRREQLDYVDQVARTPYLQKLQHTGTNVMKQGGLTIAGTVLGGLLGGRMGAVLGTALGGLIGFTQAEDYQGVPRIIANMSEDERVDLAGRIQALVGSDEFQAFLAWVTVEGNQAILQEVFRQITSG